MVIVAPKERQHLSADALFDVVRSGFAIIPDDRRSDTDISFTEALMSAFAMFSLTSPSWLTDKTQILYFQAASWYSKTKRDCRRFSSCFLEAMAGSGSGSLLKYTVVMSSQPLLSA